MPDKYAGSSERKLHHLWINDNINDVPRSARPLHAQDGPPTLDRPFLSMHFYRIQGSRFYLLDQDNAPHPAIPSLFAAATHAALHADRICIEHRDYRLTNDETPAFLLLPSDAEIRAYTDLDPNTGSDQADMVRMDNPPHPIHEGAFGTKTAALASPRHRGAVIRKGNRFRLAGNHDSTSVAQKKICNCTRMAFSTKVPPRASSGTRPDGLTAPGGCVGRGALPPIA